MQCILANLIYEVSDVLITHTFIISLVAFVRMHIMCLVLGTWDHSCELKLDCYCLFVGQN